MLLYIYKNKGHPVRNVPYNILFLYSVVSAGVVSADLSVEVDSATDFVATSLCSEASESLDVEASIPPMQLRQKQT